MARPGERERRRRTVSIRGVHIGLRRQQKLDQLNVAARQRVVQRRAATAVLPIVGVSAGLDESCGDLQARLLLLDGIALARGHLVQAAVEVSLGAPCGERREGRAE